MKRIIFCTITIAALMGCATPEQRISESDEKASVGEAIPATNPGSQSETDWDTYKSEEFGFEISLPRGYSVSTLTPEHPPYFSFSGNGYSFTVLPKGEFDRGIHGLRINETDTRIGNTAAILRTFTRIETGEQIESAMIVFNENTKLPKSWSSKWARFEMSHYQSEKELLEKILASVVFDVN